MKLRVMGLSWLLLCALSLSGCAQSWPAKESTAKLTKFPKPEAPAVLGSDPAAKAQYIVSHYWDAYPFSDTTLISNADVTEQGLADFLSVLPYVKVETAHQALTAMMQGAEADSAMYDHFVALTDRYLYDPNSPYRNEEFYIVVLNQIIGSPLLEEMEKVRPRYQLEGLLKNRVGSRAADFAYTAPDGKSGRLYGIRADYTLLFFNNPDCPDCKHYKEYIAASPLFFEWLGLGGGAVKVKILAFYPDKEMELWRKTHYPKGWINGANPALSDERLYDVRAIPSLYLLDKDKNVLLRDASLEQVEGYLRHALQNRKPVAGNPR